PADDELDIVTQQRARRIELRRGDDDSDVTDIRARQQRLGAVRDHRLAAQRRELLGGSRTRTRAEPGGDDECGGAFHPRALALDGGVANPGPSRYAFGMIWKPLVVLALAAMPSIASAQTAT